uniref:Uncharacterized protein n=1 Tax=Arundo donax TaxID=35708 RepID=A0A0A8Y715_ARUDO
MALASNSSSAMYQIVTTIERLLVVGCPLPEIIGR